MTDTLMLENALNRSNITKRKLAEELKLSEQGLYQKINNQTEFKASEISIASKVLELSVKERDKIFFGN